MFGGLLLTLIFSGCGDHSDALEESGDSGVGDSDGDEEGGSASDLPSLPDGPFEGPILSFPGESSRFIRLNHQEWENTVQDLLALDKPSGLSSGFVAEPVVGTFDNNGSLLRVSADLWSDYQRAAEALANTVARDTNALKKITQGAKTGAEFVERFGLRAFRRPLTKDELSQYTALFEKAEGLYDQEDPFADGVELVVTAMLQSPEFLYRIEASEEVVDGKIQLSDYEVASRLSYALTRTMPDAALFDAAEEDELSSNDGVVDQARRLLETSAATEMLRDFHDQLLQVRRYDDISKDPERFPLFSEGVHDDLKNEALTFIEHVVVDQELGYRELLTAPYTFGNERIAQLYGQDFRGESREEFERIDLDETQRAGILTQVGFLAANGEGGMPNTIIRGAKIAEHIMCYGMPPPPNVVPPLPPVEPDVSNRERVEMLTSVAPCSGCHGTLNPLGFGLENFNGVGAFQTEDGGKPIDATGSMLIDDERVSFDGPVEMAELMADSQQGHACYADHWARYLYARELDPDEEADAKLIEQAGRLSWTVESAKELIVNLVATDSFLTRLP
jgi:hypothetical protein